jgi:peroxiredoxin Q/BCP
MTFRQFPAQLCLLITTACMTYIASAEELKIGSAAPAFQLKKQDTQDFKLSDRKGKWTVLYFYPKAETPGCTTQACAFRDNIEKIRVLQAEVFGISVNTADEQKKFRTNHHLNFDLLADVEGKIAELYGTKINGVKMSKRWTFIIDPELKIRNINKEVDPIKDADQVAKTLKELQKKK